MAIPRRWFAIGDPQTSFQGFLGVLREHALLGEGDRLLPEVGLASIGDHFDFEPHGQDLADVEQDGTAILQWLSSHPADQVVILMGNHDAARVMELAYESDESLARARDVATQRTQEEFIAAFPRIPTRDIVLRDFRSFSEDQRAAVQEVLLSGRMRLACVGHRGGRAMLMTHAGVTTRQVEQLGCAPTAEALTGALEAHLRSAVDAVRPTWERGERAALDLTPLHVAGTGGREGGGLLYHRASHRLDGDGLCTPLAPRRFHPTELPPGLVQVCGHTGHHKCRRELEPWLAPSAQARRHGGLRTLRAGPSGISYEAAILAPRDDEATVYMIDIEMNAPEVTNHPLLDLDRVD